MITKIIRRAVLALLLITCHLSFVTSFISCADNRTPEDAAMDVAQKCYERLLEGDYEGFLSFRNDINKIPEDMRTQICDALKMYVATEERVHGGIKQVTATRAQMDSSLNVMQVYLLLSYGNGTDEEIVVPMVAAPDGQWCMK